MATALVLGGGGIAGIAWHTGMLHGLAEGGWDLSRPDLLVGTSAGATVAAQLASRPDPAYWYARQLEGGTAELRPSCSVAELWARLAPIYEEPDRTERCRRLGALALDSETVSEAERLEVLAARLDSQEWPERPVQVVAVDAATGRRVVFGAADGVPLLEAVAASCAVPGVWPPVTIGGRRYIDGGVHSLTNADLAAEFDEVVVLAPIPDAEVEGTVFEPDEASRAAFGADVLDPEVRLPCARAGYAQGYFISTSSRYSSRQ